MWVSQDIINRCRDMILETIYLTGTIIFAIVVVIMMMQSFRS